MSGWGVRLILLLNRLFPLLPMHRELHAAKLDEATYQAWEYAEAERIHRDWGPEWNLAGKRVLDVGCGLGGKLAFYAQCGAGRVIGLDLRPASARAAQALAIKRGIADRVDVIVADAARMPFALESFDVLVSVNVMEHVENPHLVLESSWRVLKRTGLAFLHFPPYFSPWGSHLEGWIHFPWPHLFFSEKTLIAALQRIEAQKQLDKGYIAQARVSWDKLEALPELNKLTSHRFQSLLRRTGWRQVRRRWLPFAYQFLRDRGWVGRLLLALVQMFSSLPGVREILTTKMVFVLQPRSSQK